MTRRAIRGRAVPADVRIRMLNSCVVVPEWWAGRWVVLARTKKRSVGSECGGRAFRSVS